MKQSESVLLVGFLRVESTKVPPVQVEDSEEAKKGFRLCFSGSANKEVSGLVPLATTPRPKVW